MKIDEFLDIIKVQKFFKQYATPVKRYYEKKQGLDGNRKPITWSKADQVEIRKAAKLLAKELNKIEFP